VAEERAGRRVDLLRVEPDVIPRGDELVHQLVRLLDAVEPGKGAGEPERAREERPLPAGASGAVLAAVAVEERARPELASKRVDGGAHPVEVRRAALEERQREHARVELTQVWRPEKRLPLPVPGLVGEVTLDLVRLAPPRLAAVGDEPVLGELAGAVEGDPAHAFRLDEVLRVVPDLPDSAVGLAPDLGDVVGDRGDLLRRVSVDPA